MIAWNVFDGLMLTLFAVCIFVWPTQLISDRVNLWLRVAAILLVVLQLMFDGPRPQLLPAYFIAALFLVLLLTHLRREQELSSIRENKEGLRKKIMPWCLVLVTSGLLLTSIVFCLVFPRFQYPAPTGNYSIATK